MTATDIHRTIDAIWRIEASRLIAGLGRMTRDLALAEELAQEALVTALTKWPETGIPDKPAAWLMATAKNRALDLFRRNEMLERKHAELARELEAGQDESVSEIDAKLDDDIGDDLLGLIFTACHPTLSTDARLALTLKVVAGLSTGEIARAFLAPEATIAQRIVRAKRTLGESGIEFEVPHGAARAERLGSVLQVIYLLFNEGYSATAGDDWMRPQLCDEALRLARILLALVPEQPEILGLVALMEIQASRTAARTAPDGTPVLLLEQDRSRWNQWQIRRGLIALGRAQASGDGSGPYVLQAAIAACHARARTAEETDWRMISDLYGRLAEVTPSPIVDLNRAVAVAMADGPEAGLEIVDRISGEPALAGYHLLPAVRGDFLARLGREDEARAEFARAADMTRNARERQILSARAAEPKD